jgi:hypothetical protein
MIPDPEYVAARRVLLDALEALGAHRKALVLVGAQAIYLRVGEGDLTVAPYTTDGDLAIDPRQLDDEPALAKTLAAAGFELAVRPGTWTLNPTDVQIDFLVPASLGGSGRRGARLGPHGTDVARKAIGLEAAVVDNTLIRVGALEPGDARTFGVLVAGLAAMLVAKLHKIAERKNDPSRLQLKDALDVLRILRFDSTAHLSSALSQLAQDPIAGEVTRVSRTFLSELFGDRSAVGSQMAARSTAGLEDEVAIAMSCEVLTQRLLEAWE